MRLGLPLRRFFWMVCACVFLLPRFAAAEPSLAIDFDLDGDGRVDQVVLDRDEPLLLHVWLSGSGMTQVIHSRVPILQVVAVDLDGDHRLELIARDSDSQLHVWKRKRKGFRPYRGHRVAVSPLDQRHCRRIEDKETQPPGEITTTPYAPFALMLCASTRASGVEPSTARVLSAARASGSATAIDPFAPRPPPAPTAL